MHTNPDQLDSFDYHYAPRPRVSSKFYKGLAYAFIILFLLACIARLGYVIYYYITH